MKRACVIGWPIAHSRSPLIHGYWLNRYDIDGSYDKRAVSPEDMPAFLRQLSDEGLSGCNVTVPHKEAAFRLAAAHEPSAEAVGAANTLWIQDGKLIAANTDTYGFITHLQTSVPGWTGHGQTIVVLGAGGAARAVVYGLIVAGAADIRVTNRSLARAADLANAFGAPVTAHPWHDRNATCHDADLIINTTTLGMKGDGDPGIDFAPLSPDVIAADIVYVPLETPFLAAARASGKRTVDGLGMLLHQAVPGFAKWFGVRPEVTAELRDLIVADIERTS